MTIWIKSTVRLEWERCPDGYALNDSQREPMLVPVSEAIEVYEIALGEAAIFRDLANVGWLPEAARALRTMKGPAAAKVAAAAAPWSRVRRVKLFAASWVARLPSFSKVSLIVSCSPCTIPSTPVFFVGTTGLWLKRPPGGNFA